MYPTTVHIHSCENDSKPKIDGDGGISAPQLPEQSEVLHHKIRGQHGLAFGK